MNKFMPFANYSQLSYQDQQALANSVDSAAGSLTAGSLLTAANTVVLDSPSTNSSLSPHSASTRMYHMLSPGNESAGSHQGSLRNTLLMNSQAPANLDFDLNYTNSNIASIVAKGSPNKGSSVGDNRQLDVLQKLNNISLNLNEKLKSPLLGEIEFFDHDDDADVLNNSKDLNGHEDDDELDNFEDGNSTDNSLKGTPDFHQRMMLNGKPNDLFQTNGFKNPNSYNIPSVNGSEMSVGGSSFVLTNKISSTKTVPIESAKTQSESSRAGSVSSNGQGGNSSSRKASFQGDINNNKDSVSPSTMAGTLVSAHDFSTPQSMSMKNTPRYQMKLQLMKQQAEQDSRKQGLPSSHSSAMDASSFTHGTLVHASNVPLPAASNSQNIIQPDNSQQRSAAESLVSTSAEIIPRSILSQVCQIETKLEYPTKYHVMQLAKGSQSSLDQLSSLIASNPAPAPVEASSSGLKKPTGSKPSRTKTSLKSPMKPTIGKNSSVSGALQINSILKSQIDSLSGNNSYNSHNSLNDSASLAGSDIAVIHNGSVLSEYVLHENLDSQSYDSNLDLSQLSSPSNSSFSLNDFPNEVDDFDPEELENFLNKAEFGAGLSNQQLEEEISEIERALNLPKTLPTEHEYFRDVLSPAQSTGSLGKAASSCPADIVRLKKLQGLNLTEEEIRLIIKDRQKKDNHNMIERRRRFNINDRIKELGTILPKSQSGEIKQNKGSILKASVDYIKNLQHQLNKTKELSEKYVQMSQLNKKLMVRIKELEMQNSSTQSSQMQSSTSTIHSSFTQSLPPQQQQQQMPSYRGSFDQLAAASSHQIPVPSRQTSQQHHQVNSMPSDAAFRNRAMSEQFKQQQQQQQQQQNYFLQQQHQQQMMQQQQQSQRQMYVTNQAGVFSPDSPLNFQKNDPLLSNSTSQFVEETVMMDGVN